MLYSKKRSLKFIVFAGILLGLGIASKISAIYILPILLLLICFYTLLPQLEKRVHKLSIGKIREEYGKNIFKNFWYLFTTLVVLFVSAYLTIRIFDPYLFESTNIIDFRISSDFIKDIQTLKSFESKDAYFPPAVQWLNKTPVIYSLFHLVLFGFGILPFTLFILGIYFSMKKYKNLEMLLVLFWVLAFFIYQSTQFSKTLRYFIFLFPFLSFFAAIGFLACTEKWSKSLKYVLLLLCLIWPAAFYSIYLQQSTRISASHFIYNTIPQDKILLVEHWDDPLPLPVDNPMKRTYTIHQLPVFDVDSDAKWKTMNEMLSQGDYLILSSNRGWGSIPTAPERYPKMQKYYDDLFNDRLFGFKKIREFTSYPSLSYLGIPISINDDIADESFTVYDHPKVVIFKKK